jgi:hypothetical protein
MDKMNGITAVSLICDIPRDCSIISVNARMATRGVESFEGCVKMIHAYKVMIALGNALAHSSEGVYMLQRHQNWTLRAATTEK